MLTRVDRRSVPALGSQRRPHAVIIGSGLGGLAAAVRLGARGYRVTVVEKLDAPGGRAYVFRQDGFTFDAGPTIITAPFLLEELWALCGKNFADDVELRSLSPFYGIRFDDGSVFETSRDAEAMREQVRRISPEDVTGYDRFFAESEAIYRVGFERLGHVPFSSLMDMVRIAPQLVKLGAWRSVYDHVAMHVRHPKLRMALSFHPLFIGGNPFRVTAIYSLIAYLERAHGVHAAIGGTGSIVRGLVRLIEGLGGELRFHSPVAHISERNGRATGVVLTSGESIAADIVVSNADAATTYVKLLPPSLARGFAERRVGKARQSMSLFIWYFGTAIRYPDVRHHTILMGPRYRELLEDIFERKILADDMSLYLHRPTATDPSLAPPGGDSFYVLSPVPNQDSGIDWEARAESYRQAIAARLEATELPGFQQHIVTSRIMTPLDFERRLDSHKGAAFGLEPIFTQSAWFRPHNRSQTLQGLYLVGAGTHPGAGVPGVLSSARVLDSVVPDAEAFA
jgi:phytoene desaturase